METGTTPSVADTRQRSWSHGLSSLMQGLGSAIGILELMTPELQRLFPDPRLPVYIAVAGAFWKAYLRITEPGKTKEVVTAEVEEAEPI